MLKKIIRKIQSAKITAKFSPLSFQKEGLNWPFCLRKFIQEERHD